MKLPKNKNATDCSSLIFSIQHCNEKAFERRRAITLRTYNTKHQTREQTDLVSAQANTRSHFLYYLLSVGSMNVQ